MKIDVEALRVAEDEKVSLADRPTSVERLYGDAAKLLNRSKRPTTVIARNAATNQSRGRSPAALDCFASQ